MKKQAYFITGTDTGVGKTYVTRQLLRQHVAQGHKTIAMKAVAAGCEMIEGIWQNEDVAHLRALSNVDAPLELVNPYCFDEPIAPHIAAEKAGVNIEIAPIKQAFMRLTELADVVIVEGAGGLLVPLNASQTVADLIKALEVPLILVAGIRLGCINHTLLTVEAIKARGLPFHGWVANHLASDTPFAAENVATLTQRIGMPPLFENSWQGA